MADFEPGLFFDRDFGSQFAEIAVEGKVFPARIGGFSINDRPLLDPGDLPSGVVLPCRQSQGNCNKKQSRKQCLEAWFFHNFFSFI